MYPPIRPLPDRALIGMVHLLPLPGSPLADGPLARIVDRACADARVLAESGFDAILIENFGDAPFRASRVEPHTIACMTVAAGAVGQAVALPSGINVLRNDARGALAVAMACGAVFVRVNVHCGVYATDQGIIEGRADETLRYRRALGGSHASPHERVAVPAIFADVHVKHARPLSSSSISEAAEEIAGRGRADALIVSGSGTGKPTDLDDLRAVKSAVPDRPVYVGSGATAENVHALLAAADGVIVGTAIKQDGQTTAPVDAARATAFVRAARS
jgi:hypothetical protein